ncbi:unnamed protein product [Phytomonas sp. EM1]|nr:unnamed protein product [Phytomonas sp. EM1]|eukprot:CCW64098.1 unnamed protein product [Phytomonas sp. isolate EM1]
MHRRQGVNLLSCLVQFYSFSNGKESRALEVTERRDGLEELTYCAALKSNLSLDEAGVATARAISPSSRGFQGLGVGMPRSFESDPPITSGNASIPRVNTAESLKNVNSDFSVGLFAVPATSLEDAVFEEDEFSAKPTREHVWLAYRALAWGTLYAFVGFVVVILLGMAASGYYGLSALLEGVREKAHRDEKRFFLSAQTLRRNEDGSEASLTYTIDLSQPTFAIQQMKELWQLLHEEALQEGNLDKRGLRKEN